jgi:hypothetical protein
MSLLVAGINYFSFAVFVVCRYCVAFLVFALLQSSGLAAGHDQGWAGWAGWAGLEVQGWAGQICGKGQGPESRAEARPVVKGTLADRETRARDPKVEPRLAQW